MPRRILTIWTLVAPVSWLGFVLGPPPKPPGALQPPATSSRVSPGPVAPDTAYETAEGTRVEIYSSVGNIEGSVDWRPVNEFAYLVSSVPMYQYIHATIYNGYWDHDQVTYNSTTKKWEIYEPATAAGPGAVQTRPFGPTKAFADQLNKYDNDTDRKKYINTLGSSATLKDGYQKDDFGNYFSSLSVLLSEAKILKLCTTTKDGACLRRNSTDTGIMHSKYALFSQAKDSNGKLWNNVVWITSANLNGASGGKKSNISVAIFGDQAAYTGLLNDVYKAQVAQTKTAGYVKAGTFGLKASTSGVTFYPSPRLGTAWTLADSLKAGGTVRDMEGNFLESQRNTNLGGSKSSCKVYLVHSLFSTYRKAVLTQMSNLQKEKCTVKVVLGTNALDDIASSYFTMSREIRKVIDTMQFANVHDKTTTITYTLDGVAVGKTLAGSANLNGTSMYTDELQVRIADRRAADAVVLQSERLYKLAAAGTNVIPVTGVTITPSASSVEVGKTLALQVAILPSNSTVKTLTWASSNPAVAEVDSRGVVTGVATGSATITAQADSGDNKATATVTVVPATTPPTTPPTTQPETPSTISTPPTLSLPAYVTSGSTVSAKVSWSQNGAPLSGKVQLQYYSTSRTWTNYGSPITVTSGAGSMSLPMKYGHPWRVKAVSGPDNSTLSSSAVYSSRLSQVIIVVGTPSSTPKLFAPNLIDSGVSSPYAVQWKNPYGSKYPNTLVLQYATSTGWKSHQEITIPAGSTTHKFSLNIFKSHKWRVVSSSKSRPSGTRAVASSSVTVNVV